MDLIYRNAVGSMEKILSSYELDMEIGYGAKNDFELVTAYDSSDVLEAGGRIYVEDSDIGGIITSISVNTKTDEITYKGLTWTGLMASHIICPASGSDYYTITSSATGIMANLLITIGGMGDLFVRGNPKTGDLTVQYDRYTDTYTAAVKLLKKNGLKLDLKYDASQEKVVYECHDLVDYTTTSELDTSVAKLEVCSCLKPVNHIICLGKGELKNRWVIHLYADANGAMSTTQTLTGLDEITAVYDYPNVESQSELMSKGWEKLAELRAEENKVSVLLSDDTTYDVGDKIVATDESIGISVTTYITQKIYKIKNGDLTVTYEVGAI